MKLKMLLIMGVIGGLCACNEDKGYFSPNEIPTLTSECEMLSEKEMALVSNNSRTDTLPDGTVMLSNVYVYDTLPDGSVKAYSKVYEKEEIIYTHEHLAEYPYFQIDKSFCRATRKLLSKEIIAPGYITIGTSYRYDEAGKLKEEKQEEKGYKFCINQLLNLLNDKGIVIPKMNFDDFPTDTIHIGKLAAIDREVINGKPCYSILCPLFKKRDSMDGYKILEIDGTNGRIFKEKDEYVFTNY